MATLIQRKRFDHPELALAAVDGFRHIDPSIPGVNVTVEAREVDGESWVYVTQDGELVTGEEPLLPDFERVS